MGACYLRRTDVRREVVRCLLHFDGTRYDIDSFVVMPNHVHILMTPSAGYDLSKLIQGFKGVRARSCNRLIGRNGKFWMDESYDRVVRDPNELMAFRDYIAQNPTKAGLKQHQYSVQMRNVLIV